MRSPCPYVSSVRIQTLRFYLYAFVFTYFANLDLFLAALFLWINPFRAARSSSRTAAPYACVASSLVVALRTRFTAVRRADRWARFSTAWRRDWRIAFLADLICGTGKSPYRGAQVRR